MYFFKFAPHCTPKLKDVHSSFNNAYSEPFTDSIVAALFTDTNRTTIDLDALKTIRTEIVDLIYAGRTSYREATWRFSTKY